MAMKLCIAGVLGILISILSFADPILRKPIQIDHLNVDYGNKIGKGQVQFMTYHFDNMSLDHKNLTADLEMKGDTLSISDGTTKFSVSKTLDFINYFDSIRAEDLNFFLENSHFNGSLPKTFLGLTGHHYYLEQLAATCGTLERDVPTMDDDSLLLIIEMCLGDSKISFDQMSFPLEAPFGGIMNSVIDDVFNNKSAEKIAVSKIKNFNLNFDDHAFTAHAKVKLKIDLGVYVSGKVEFEAEKSRYKLELKSASVGFIPVRWLIFRAIRNLKDASITVEEPNIYIVYKKPFESQHTRKTVNPFK